MSSSWEDVGVAVASMVLATFSMFDKPKNVFLITFTGAPCFPISAIASPNSPTVEANFCRIPATLSTLDDGIFNAATGGSTVPLPNDPALFSSLTRFLASSALQPTMVGNHDSPIASKLIVLLLLLQRTEHRIRCHLLLQITMHSMNNGEGSHNSSRSSSMVSPICYCGKSLTLRTSWTTDNPGRRFWVCIKDTDISTLLYQFSNICIRFVKRSANQGYVLQQAVGDILHNVPLYRKTANPFVLLPILNLLVEINWTDHLSNTNKLPTDAHRKEEENRAAPRLLLSLLVCFIELLVTIRSASPHIVFDTLVDIIFTSNWCKTLLGFGTFTSWSPVQLIQTIHVLIPIPIVTTSSTTPRLKLVIYRQPTTTGSLTGSEPFVPFTAPPFAMSLGFPLAESTDKGASSTAAEVCISPFAGAAGVGWPSCPTVGTGEVAGISKVLGFDSSDNFWSKSAASIVKKVKESI
nr:Os08g0556050 [Ipomoea batatas]